MNAPHLDPLYVLIGISALTLTALGLTAACASLPSARRGITPPPTRAGESYRCYCWQQPVVVHVAGPQSGKLVSHRRNEPAYYTSPAARQTGASHAGASSREWGASPIRSDT